jgi:protein-tyrosine phosphatase
MSLPTSRAIRAEVATLVLLALVIVCCPTDGLAERRDATTSDATGLPAIRIKNFGRVNANYFRGAEPRDEEYAKLASVGIRTVIDLRSDDVDAEDRLLVERAGMKYVRIPMTTHVPPTSAVIERFLGLVDDPKSQPVYVHCVGGRHRTGVMTAVYRMVREGWAADRAFKEMKAYRFGADYLHPEFKKFVYTYRPDPRLIGMTSGVSLPEN